MQSTSHTRNENRQQPWQSQRESQDRKEEVEILDFLILCLLLKSKKLYLLKYTSKFLSGYTKINYNILSLLRASVASFLIIFPYFLSVLFD